MADQTDRLIGLALTILEVAMNLNNDAEKVKFIHDFLINTVHHDCDSDMNQSAYSSIVLGETVCAGYSYAFAYYMQRLGIPVTILYGDTIAGYHAWNVLRIDHEYYSMDVTWDDISNLPDVYYYKYFNITDEIMNLDHTRDTEGNMLPISNGTKYSYPNYFNSPGSDFSEINFGRNEKELPFVYVYLKP